MKALITGISGFVGPYLANHLLEKDYEVFGLDKNITEIKNITFYQADILNKDKIFDIIYKIKPDCIFHLAAQSSPAKSFDMPKLTMDIIVNGTKNILDSIINSKINPSILVISSAHVYGIPKQVPIKENHALQPNSPYAEARVKQEELALEYQKKGINIIILRSFNHTGPGQSSIFVCSDFAKQIVEIEKGSEPIISVGNLTAKRNFTDVRDIVKAYSLAVEKCVPGEIYNVCSTKIYSIKEILDKLLSFSKVKIKIEQDPDKMRSSDTPIMQGDNTKFRNQTGWIPKIPLEQTLKDILEYWRNKLA